MFRCDRDGMLRFANGNKKGIFVTLNIRHHFQKLKALSYVNWNAQNVLFFELFVEVILNLSSFMCGQINGRNNYLIVSK